MTIRTLSYPAVVLAAVISLGGCSPRAQTLPASPTPTQPSPQPGSGEAFIVSGWVADSAARMIAGARIEVVTGAQAGTVVTSDDAGRFGFATPIDAFVQLRASKAGYLDDFRAVSGNASASSRINFNLRSSNPPVDLTGHHRITFVADSACANLPAAARRRSYQANITSRADLYGATFGGSQDGTYLWRVLYLLQFEDYARFLVQDPPVWELLPNDSYVVIWGDATGNVGPGDNTLTFWGTFTYCPALRPGSNPVCAVEEITCQSAQHRMSMTRY